MNTYTFAGWDRQITAVSSGDHSITYTATYTATPKEYTLAFLGEDGSTIQSGRVHYGDTPVYTGAAPVKETDGRYAYTFLRWEPEITAVTGDIVYSPVFSAVPFLQEGRNRYELTKYEPETYAFIPEKSGYYRLPTENRFL